VTSSPVGYFHLQQVSSLSSTSLLVSQRNAHRQTVIVDFVLGLGEIGSGCNNIRTEPPPHNLGACMCVFSDMKARLAEYNCEDIAESTSDLVISKVAVDNVCLDGQSCPSNVATIGESVYSAVIRCCCSNHDIQQALKVYTEMKLLGVGVKLRTFISLLQLVSCSEGSTAFHRCEEDLDEQGLLKRTLSDSLFTICYDIFTDMTVLFHLQPTEREYVCMLRASVRANEAVIFHRTLTDYMEDVLVPSKTVWEVLSAWFCPPPEILGRYHVCDGSRTGYEKVFSAVDDAGNLLSCMGRTLLSIELTPSNKEALLEQIEGLATAEDDEVKVSERSQVVEISTQRLEDSRAANSSHAREAERFDGGGVDTRKRKAEEIDAETSSADHLTTAEPNGMKKLKGKRKHLDVTIRIQKFAAYKQWLAACKSCEVTPSPADFALKVHDNDGNQHEGASLNPMAAGSSSGLKRPARKFDIIVDGANVGYYKQNFAGAPSHVDYQQIDWVVSSLRLSGYTPLLILHCRYA
jgi:pentatricopeptide repeat protein